MFEPLSRREGDQVGCSTCIIDYRCMAIPAVNGNLGRRDGGSGRATREYGGPEMDEFAASPHRVSASAPLSLRPSRLHRRAIGIFGTVCAGDGIFAIFAENRMRRSRLCLPGCRSLRNRKRRAERQGFGIWSLDPGFHATLPNPRSRIQFRDARRAYRLGHSFTLTSTGTFPGGGSGQRGVRKMLVLSRHRDESIIIGDNIVITIVDIRGDKVRLGIQAPTDIPVHRQEVYEAIQREKSAQAKDQASSASPGA